MPQLGIYLVTCLETGEQYIGQSRDISTRWQAHRTLLKQGRHTRLWQEAWDRYGADAFTWEVLEEVGDWRRLNERERHYIHGLRPAVNEQPLTADAAEMTETPTRSIERYAPSDGKISVGLTIIHEGEPTPEYLALWRRLLAPIASDAKPVAKAEE